MSSGKQIRNKKPILHVNIRINKRASARDKKIINQTGNYAAHTGSFMNSEEKNRGMSSEELYVIKRRYNKVDDCEPDRDH